MFNQNIKPYVLPPFSSHHFFIIIVIISINAGQTDSGYRYIQPRCDYVNH